MSSDVTDTETAPTPILDAAPRPTHTPIPSTATKSFRPNLSATRHKRTSTSASHANKRVRVDTTPAVPVAVVTEETTATTETAATEETQEEKKEEEVQEEKASEEEPVTVSRSTFATHAHKCISWPFIKQDVMQHVRLSYVCDAVLSLC